MGRRDEFSEKTKLLLAQRVGYSCSRPGCPNFTIGPAEGDGGGVINLGQAAHITAAAEGGPRYDPGLTPAQRKALANGIWLCLMHARQVDADESAYTVATLRKWKSEAEARSQVRNEVAKPSGFDAFGIGDESGIAPIRERLLPMAQADLDAFRRVDGWPIHPVELSLTITNEHGSHSFSPGELAVRLRAWRELVIVSSPGTGKSTTIVQIAGYLVNSQSTVSACVRLAEWASRQGSSLLESVLDHYAFSSASSEDLRTLAAAGELTIFLDGWNELDDEARDRARSEIQQLKRDFPDLGLVLTTRQQGGELPVRGSSAVIEPLSRRQRREIAFGILGDRGQGVLADAEGTDGIRELIRVPLFLFALLSSSLDESPPSNGEQLLSRFIREQERRSRQRSDALERETLGFHDAVLRLLAAETNKRATTVLTDDVARPLVSSIYRELFAQGQIGALPHPGDVLDALVNEHLLVRPAQGQQVRFQHQQIQEWYASFEVERCILGAGSDSGLLRALREDILNWRPWEESVLFACQRETHELDEAFGEAVRICLEIDPLLSAEMIFCRPSLWNYVGEAARALVREWHETGKVDPAFAFMKDTGRVEFVEITAPLLLSRDFQVLLDALRSGSRTLPASFGPVPIEQIEQLTEQAQIEIGLELAERGGLEGRALAVSVASRSAREDVSARIAEYLHERGFDSDVIAILGAVGDESKSAIANRISSEESDSPELEALLSPLRRAQTQELSAAGRLRQMLRAHQGGGGIDESEFVALFASPTLGSDVLGGLQIYSFPELALRGLRARVISRMALPYGAATLAIEAGLIDDSPELSELALNLDDRASYVEYAVVTAGERSVRALLLQLLEIDQSRGNGGVPDAVRDQWIELTSRLRRVPLSSLISVITADFQSASGRERSLLASLIVRDGVGDRRNPALGETQTRAAEQWLMDGAAQLIAMRADRSECSEIATAIGAVRSDSLSTALLDLLQYDLETWREERSAVASGNRDPSLVNRSRTSFAILYGRALVSLGTSQIASGMVELLTNADFCDRAAIVLVEIERKASRQVDGEPAWWTNSLSRRIRSRSLARWDTRPIHPFAQAIFRAAGELLRQEEPRVRELGVRLVGIGLLLPCGDPRPLVAAALDGPCSLESRYLVWSNFAACGGVLSADSIMATIEANLSEAERLNRGIDWEHGTLARIFPLFAVSDSPSIFFRAISRLPERLSLHYQQRATLAMCADAGGQANLDLLFELATRDESYFRLWDWWSALCKFTDVESTRRILRWITSADFNSEVLRHERAKEQLGDMFASVIQAEPAFRAEVYAVLLTLQCAREVSSALCRAVSSSPDAEGVLVLLRNAAHSGEIRIGWIHGALRRLCVGEEEIPDWPGAKQLSAVAVSDLRRNLFALTADREPGVAKLASMALADIEEIRQDFGYSDGEPRHPAIDLPHAWPIRRAQIA